MAPKKTTQAAEVTEVVEVADEAVTTEIAVTTPTEIAPVDDASIVDAKPDPRELVQLYIPPATRPNEEKYAMVWVNGKSWSMRKGFVHMVPRYVFNEHHRAQNAQARALERHENRRKLELEHNAAMAQKIGSTNAM